MAGANSIVGQHISSADRVIAYLPLAHIFELVFENACLFWGAILGYAHPRTLSDTTVRNCAGDLRELKPTLMVGVPAIWETVRKGILQKVSEGGIITRTLFHTAIKSKRFLCENSLPGTQILDSFVFNKVAAATGGNLRLCMNGAGPIAQSTQEFISLTICPMIAGYGITETTAYVSSLNVLHSPG